MASVRKNAFYNILYQVVRLIFPIITYPYVSRILGPEGLGEVSFAQTVANNFITFGLLGIPVYAAREISKSRNRPDGVHTVYSEILVLTFGLSFIITLMYISLACFGGNSTGVLYMLFAVEVATAWLRLDWFYQGIEEFRYITVRNLIIRCASLIIMFVVIHESDHYVRYGLIWIGGTLVSGIVNFWHAFKYTRVTFKIRFSSLLNHVYLSLPSAVITISSFVYGSIDVIMLGWLVDDGKASVGYYNVAGRITRIIITVVAAANAVVGVRVALKKAQGRIEEICRYIRKSIGIVLYFGLPCMLGIAFIARDFILVFAGDGFLPSVETLRILCFEIILISFSGIIISQILYAQGREKEIVVTLGVCLVVAVFLNMWLIPRYFHVGAAMATLVTRCLELVLLIWFGRKQLHASFDYKSFLKLVGVVALWALLTIGLIAALSRTELAVRLPSTICASAIVYVVLSRLFRLEQYTMIEGALLSKFRKKKKGTDS